MLQVFDNAEPGCFFFQFVMFKLAKNLTERCTFSYAMHLQVCKARMLDSGLHAVQTPTMLQFQFRWLHRIQMSFGTSAKWIHHIQAYAVIVG